MRDLWHRTTNWVDHNRGTFLGVALALVVVVGAVLAPGCEPTTKSLRNPTIQVTEAEFLIEAKGMKNELLTRMGTLSVEMDAMEKEVHLFEARTDVGLADIETERMKYVAVLEALENISMQAATGTLNPLALIPMAFGLGGLLFGVGRGYDNKRKDAVIADLKNGGTPAT